jgi:hypothetical protein
MNFKKLIAASLDLNIDYDRMTQELLEAKKSSKCVSFSYPPERNSIEKVTSYSLFLRTNPTFVDYSYRGAKQSHKESWTWDDSLPISYTRSVLDKIPYSSLGAIRVVYFPDAACPPHTDWDDSGDSENTLGLSIIPNTGDTWCNVWHEGHQCYVPIHGNAMLLNDSIQHEVPKPTGVRITMRVFGKIDYSWFLDKINQEYCYYLD